MKLFLLLITCAALAAFASAQSPQPLTELTGTVSDQAGAVIVDVQVILTDSKGKKYETRTRDDGSYSLKVAAGPYLIEAEYTQHKAWEAFKVEKYEVAATKRMTFDICLRIDEKFTEIHGTPVTSEKKRKP
jgi:hypothetical protein